MTEVWFRDQYSVQDLIIPADGTYRFEYGEPHHVMVHLRPPTGEEQAVGHKSENAFCESHLRMPVSSKNASVFGEIAANRVVPADKQEGGSYPGPDGALIRIPGLSAFPEHFRSFLKGARHELADFTTRTVGVLRWRAGRSGPHSPIRPRGFGFGWSWDGGFWHMAPMDTSLSVMVVQRDLIGNDVVDDVQKLVANRAAEPIGHNMLREAAERTSSDPRSAVVIGLAAAELGVKRCIAILEPGAEWLITHIPSPPLEKILTDYLPLLPTRKNFAGVVKAPPPEVMSAIKKGVSIRNGVVHAGTPIPTEDTAIEILDAVRDLLFLLDYYCGNDWAFDHLRSGTRQALIAD
jgi:hypothetical protein